MIYFLLVYGYIIKHADESCFFIVLIIIDFPQISCFYVGTFLRVYKLPGT
jgi:hypothetical protein